MRIDHLKYLIVVAETGSISHAAERLYISQQGLSQAIRQLEKQIGVTLLDRIGNRIYLTDVGMEMVEKAREILSKYEELIVIAHSSEKPASRAKPKEITLLTTPFLAGSLLSEVVTKFRQKHPHTHLVIDEKLPPDILKALQINREAIGLFSVPCHKFSLKELNEHNLSFEPFYECELLACVAKASPLASRKSISPAELVQHPLAILDIGQNAENIYTFLDPLGKINVILKTGNSKLYREMISNGLAVGFSNSFLEFFERRDSIVTIPIENAYSMILGWVYAADTPRSDLLNELIQELMRYVKH